jgi:hypothetical protein
MEIRGKLLHFKLNHKILMKLFGIVTNLRLFDMQRQ